MVYRSVGGENVTGVSMEVSVAFSANATNYWTIQPRIMRSGQTFGEDLGAGLDLSTITLNAEVVAILYDDPIGVELKSGDRIVIELTATGSPAQLTDPTFWTRTARKVG